MCRLFGFRSVLSSRVHTSLVGADNALVSQSERHPDGWGVAYYREDAPHLVKSPGSALACSLFRHVSGVVTSETVVAHLRKATQGERSVINTHPFQYGPWVFAHNGNLKGFASVRPRLVAAIDPELRPFLLGDTDSEVIFYLLLGELRRRADLRARDYSVAEVCAAIASTRSRIVATVGDYCLDDDGDPQETYLTFILTNGLVMAAHQGGKTLYYSTYKRCCPERDTCPKFAPECEQAATDHVNHLIFASEPLQGDNVWLPMAAGQMVGVDAGMALHTVG
ncbi:MAG: class II glutamine amidotransferase [Nitrospirota bacterium]|jgi:glutamine amidotransferase